MRYLLTILAERRNPIYLALLLLLAIWICLPVLLNAHDTHADATIVGLQAMHVLEGEWSWFLWGAGYQGVADVVLVAVAFYFFGPSPLVLALVPLVGHLIVIWTVFSISRRRLSAEKAFFLTLIVVIVPQSILGVALFVPRQWSITLIFVAFRILDSSCFSSKRHLRQLVGTFCVVCALYFDFFTILIVPGAAVFIITCCRRGENRDTFEWKGLAYCALGGIIGLLVIFLLHRMPGATTGSAGVYPPRFIHNLKLLWNECLPLLLSYKIYLPGTGLYPEFWDAPWYFEVIQKAGAILFSASIVISGLIILKRQSTWEKTGLGLLGLTITGTVLVSFLVSRAPQDMWAARYLAPIVWFAPFSLIPLAGTIKARHLALILLPYLIATYTAAWIEWGDRTRGLLPAQTAAGQGKSEGELQRALKERGIKYGTAQYWLTYRLTFLFQEDVILVPTVPYQDRYGEYRRGFRDSQRVAYIFNEKEPREKPQPYEMLFRRYGLMEEKVEVGGYVVLIAKKKRGTEPIWFR